jgi:molybdopterin/thiamine biosynthesis adenylyltransferase
MSNGRFSRQSFLGEHSERQIADCLVGIMGLGGGGSHVVQQFAHIGFQRFVIFDDDRVEESNLNRLVGAEARDASAETPKLLLAKRMIFGLQPYAAVKGYAAKWQQVPEALRECHIVIGCVDGYQQRRELEIACRRYLIHYIDIGMDVHGVDRPVIGGQVILSSPGGPCMKCMGFLTDEALAEEAKRYGDAGSRPQVVWPNGVLAATAVGLAVELATGWTRKPRSHAFLMYNGNDATVSPERTLARRNQSGCAHFDTTEVGDPVPLAL